MQRGRGHRLGMVGKANYGPRCHCCAGEAAFGPPAPGAVVVCAGMWIWAAQALGEAAFGRRCPAVLRSTQLSHDVARWGAVTCRDADLGDPLLLSAGRLKSLWPLSRFLGLF